LTGRVCEVMLFDTGTNTTILAPSLAARLGLVGGDATAIESIDGTTHAMKGEVRGIGFDGIPGPRSKVAIAASVEGLRGLAPSIAGIYGHDWLAGIDYVIDYASKRLVLGSPGTLMIAPGARETGLCDREGGRLSSRPFALTRSIGSQRVSFWIPPPTTSPCSVPPARV
jgi:hypothetical protein